MLFIILLLHISSGTFHVENQDLQTRCRGPQGISCLCRLSLIPIQEQNVVITISSCYRQGGWTEWSSWSSCRDSQQRRRRSCSRPSPIGLNSSCPGARSESRPCLNSIPEYFWGQWSPWNEWSDCDCMSSARTRTRQCMGRSCEGCGQETVLCSKDCPKIRKHSEWTNWIGTGSQETRYRCLTTSSDLTTQSELEEETRTTTKDSVWSDWEIRRGVALRYRNRTVCHVQSQLLTLSPSLSKVPIAWLTVSSAICMFLGFFSHCCLYPCFQRKRTKIDR